ncbi:MAG: hypothetical protein WCO56_13110 [Verrucomicrobiota bacterium]
MMDQPTSFPTQGGARLSRQAAASLLLACLTTWLEYQPFILGERLAGSPGAFRVMLLLSFVGFFGSVGPLMLGILAFGTVHKAEGRLTGMALALAAIGLVFVAGVGFPWMLYLSQPAQ